VIAPRLTDGVIVLDQHTVADADAHLAGEDEEQARRFGWHPARSTPESIRRTIEKWRAQWESDGPTRAFATRDSQTAALAGGCELRLRKNQIAEVSYWVFPTFRGRGFAGRAVSLACRWAFGELGVQRIELYIEPDNTASRKAAVRAGFIEEGVLRGQGLIGDERRDMVLYARLPSDASPEPS
jgi:RimJ/RimL family protein N-acetyltransferase